MRTIRTLLASLALILTTTHLSAQPMSYYAMRNNARYLTDRMAYTLGIATSLLDDLYMINYDYIYGINDYLDDLAYGYHANDYAIILASRDAALRRLLTPYQWQRYISYDYFYRPIVFDNHSWRFSIYTYDPHYTHFYYNPPRHYNDYRGGHYFAGMRPAGGHVGPGRTGDHHRPTNYNHGHGSNRGGQTHGGSSARPSNPGGNTGGHNPESDNNRGGNHTNSGHGTSNNHRGGTHTATPSTRTSSNGTTRGAGRR